MSEKGGKGGSLLSKGGFSKGKDDSATKSSSKGRRVQFSSEGPFESGISSSHSSLKSGGKGGKGQKVANGGSGKSSESKDPNAQHRVDEKLPENIKCLIDCEAAEILRGIQEQMVVLSRDSSIKMPVAFDKGLQYAKSNSKFIHAQSVRHILEPLSNYGLTDSEICVIGNVGPETLDELFALLPSLKERKNIDKQVLKDSLYKLSKHKQQV